MNSLEDIIRARAYAGPQLRFNNVALGTSDSVSVYAGAEFVGASLSNLEFNDSDFSVNFTKGTFHNVSFINCRFDRVRMRQSSWHSCRFDGSVMVPDMTDAVFEQCSFIGSRIKGLGQAYGGRRTKFVRCNFTDCKLERVQFLAGRLVDCEVSSLRSVSSDLRGTTHNGLPLQPAA